MPSVTMALGQIMSPSQQHTLFGIPKAVTLALQAIVLERPVFVREQSDGLYRVITYLTFKVLEEVVLATASSVVFSLLVYYLVRLQGSFFPVWIVFLVTQLVGVGELSHLFG